MRRIIVRDGEIVLANYSAVFCFDPDWNLTRMFTHPSCSSIYEILFGGSDLLINSSVNDLVFKLDGEARIIYRRSIHEQKV